MNRILYRVIYVSICHMVSTESATVVNELPHVATTLLPGCERLSLTNWWRCIDDLMQHYHNSWRLTGNSFAMLATTVTFVDLSIFFKQFKKVAKRLRGLATIDDGRQCTGKVLAIIGTHTQLSRPFAMS